MQEGREGCAGGVFHFGVSYTWGNGGYHARVGVAGMSLTFLLKPYSANWGPLTDIIELGFPFTEPIVDGPAIQKNTQALKNGVTVTLTLQMVRGARKQDLRVPVLLMGYYPLPG